MEIRNASYHLPARKGTSWLEAIGPALEDAVGQGSCPLRFSITETCRDEVLVEATLVRLDANDRFAGRLALTRLSNVRRRRHAWDPFVAVQVIPTGIRCEYGGFAGDACPATNLLAAAAGVLVAHPNAVNASELNEMAANVLYVEGRSLDDFLLGHIGLLRVQANKIGTFIDPTGEAFVDDVVNTINAARAVKGIDCALFSILPREIGVAIEWSEAGCAVGTVRHPESILDAAEFLISQGADAVGGVSVIRGVTAEMFSRHLNGEIPNPSGGVEAIITHLISLIFRIPAAHAPLPYYRGVKEPTTQNPRASAEFISTPHYFSVLKGLAKAPRLIPIADLSAVPGPAISVNNVGAIVTPASSLGGIPALAAEFNGIPLVAVRDNATILNVTNDKMKMHNVIEVDSYLEAAGVVLALREGISLESLRRPIPAARLADLRERLQLAVPAAESGSRDRL